MSILSSISRGVVSAAVVAMVCITPSDATADLVDHVSAGHHVVIGDGPGTTGGGEFNITVLETLDTFISFCLQKTRYLNFRDTFTVTGVNPYAMTEGLSTGGDGTGHDEVSNQTAYLYFHFRRGTLTGYAYGTTASANDLQRAIWWFEGEDVNPGNAFVALANNAVAGGWVNPGAVRVINLAFPDGRDAQDQLTMVPEPVSVGLLGVGLALVGWRLRRSRPSGGLIE